LSFAEVNIFGVYVAPISVIMGSAWIITIGLRHLAVRVGLLSHVWHPSLFVFAIYIVILSSLTLLIAGRALW
jgi:hypothetical protein